MDFSQVHKVNGEIFKSRLLEFEGAHTEACNVYELLTEGNEDHENCLDENFNQLITQMHGNFFNCYSQNKDTELDFYFSTYIQLLANFTKGLSYTSKYQL